MAGVSIHLDVSQALAYAAHVERSAAEMPAKTRVVVTRTGRAIQNTGKRNAPVGSGYEDIPGELRDSITLKVSGDTAEISSDLSYSEYVEDGTSIMAAQPYLGPAFDQHAPLLETELEAIAVEGLL